MSAPKRPAGHLEILAPAGGADSLTAAVRAGADAVYLGLNVFNARQNAKNFDADALRDAVRDCHARGVRVYLTLNTLVTDRELPAAMSAVRDACEAGVDALIVQDLGLTRLIKEAAPSLPLHASTQTSVHSPDGLNALARMGFTRAVLPRELSREEIARLAASSPIELEVFVHGAHCMSVSGQCLMSAFLGGRSGNRGLCAQPCRLPFTAENGTEYALSLKDLSLTDRLRELESLGVASAKIEGRMKRPEYVAAAVKACRAALDDGRVEPVLEQQLRDVFSRSGFTSGYYDGKRGGGMRGRREEKDVAASGGVLAELSKIYLSERPSVGVDLELTVRSGEPASLCASDGETSVTIPGEIPEKARTRALDEERTVAQLRKTGGTPFFVRDCAVFAEPGLTLPVSAVNALRRAALETLLAARGKTESIPFSMPEFSSARSPEHSGAPALFAVFDRAQTALKVEPDALKCARRVFVPLLSAAEDVAALCESGVSVGVDLGRAAAFGGAKGWKKRLALLIQAGAEAALVHGVGEIEACRELGIAVYGSNALNIMNDTAAQVYADLGLSGAVLSAELSGAQARMITALPAGLFAYGRIPLMLMRCCPASASCASCKGKGSKLTDRMGVSFPVRCTGAGFGELLNSVPVYLADKLPQLSSYSFLLLSFTDESPEQAAALLRAYAGKIPPEAPGAFTRGLWAKGVQ